MLRTKNINVYRLTVNICVISILFLVLGYDYTDCCNMFNTTIKKMVHFSMLKLKHLVINSNYVIAKTMVYQTLI